MHSKFKSYMLHLDQLGLTVSYDSSVYNWPLNNMGLNCAGPLTRSVAFFFFLNNQELKYYTMWLVESVDAELRIKGSSYRTIFARELGPLTLVLFRGQLYFTWNKLFILVQNFTKCFLPPTGKKEVIKMFITSWLNLID